MYRGVGGLGILTANLNVEMAEWGGGVGYLSIIIMSYFQVENGVCKCDFQV